MEAVAEGQSRARRPLFKNPFFWGAIAGVLFVTAIRPLYRKEPAPPPVIGQLPPFELIDANGRPFGSKQLEGKVWVASFFFTSCPSICPKLNAQVKKLQDRWAEWKSPIEIVSISVDPDTDRPEVLARYAQGIGADPARWHFLTGDAAAVKSVVTQGFMNPMGDKEPVAGGFDIAHSGRLMLIDGKGGIRGIYDSTDLGIDELFHRANHVHLAQ
jgi:protein SCO1/2